jgi:hypothetical protein
MALVVVSEARAKSLRATLCPKLVSVRARKAGSVSGRDVTHRGAARHLTADFEELQSEPVLLGAIQLLYVTGAFRGAKHAVGGGRRYAKMPPEPRYTDPVEGREFLDHLEQVGRGRTAGGPGFVG